MEGNDDVSEARDNCVGRGTGRHGYFRGKPRKGVADAFCSSIPDPHIVALIGFECRANVPAVEGMGRPGFAVAWFFMCQHSGGGGADWRSIVIECAMDLGPGR